MDVAGFLLEGLTLSLAMLAGVSIAWAMGARQWGLVIGLGVLIGYSWRWVSFVFLSLFGAFDADEVVWYGGIVVMLAVGAWSGLRRKQFVLVAGAGVLLSFLAAVPGRLFELGAERAEVLAAAEAIVLGDVVSLGGVEALRGGFGYALMVALGFTGFDTLAFLAMLAALVWLLQSLVSVRWWLATALSVLAVAAAFSAPMVWRGAVELGPHVVNGLAVVLAAGAAAIIIREQRAVGLALATLMISLSAVSTSRVEGVALALAIALPLVSARWWGASLSRRWVVRLILLSALVPFGVWMWTYDAYLTRSFRFDPWEFLVLALTLSFLAGLEIFDWFRERAAHIAFAVVGLAWVAFGVGYGRALLPGLEALWLNLALGHGQWGVYLLAVVPVMVAVGWRDSSREYRLLAITTLLIIVVIPTSKLVAGLPLADPLVAQLGWADSVNRMWLQGFAMFIAMGFVGLAQRIAQRWPAARAVG